MSEMEFATLAIPETAIRGSIVSGYSSLDDKELVRQAVDIVELIGSQIPLRRQGRNYVGLCPWHDDTKPSLQVNPERQSFKCWVCDIGGDVFTWMMKIEGVEFREALQMLADRAGIQLKQMRGGAGQNAAGEFDVGDTASGEGKRTLYKAMAWAEEQYHKCLLDMPEAEHAREYLLGRDVTAESIEKFHLGFSPNQRDWMLRLIENNPSRAKILETIGVLAIPQAGGNYYDRFRGRLLFSIRDTQARPVGFGGRVLPESGTTSPAKYVNSPETPLFSKSNLLYGLDVAREGLRKTRTALVMEGYTDVIVAHQYGFDNAVAVLGTALGDGHIKILKRFADRIVLVLDGDEAGQRRANEVLELFVAQQVDLSILTLPEGTDPCDFLHEHGAEAFTELLEEKSIGALDHAFRAATGGLNLEHDVHGASQALEKLVSIVATAPRLRHDTTGADRFREEKILQRLAAWFRVDEKDVRQRLTALRRRAGARRPRPMRPEETTDVVVDEQPPEQIGPLERELLELLICHPAGLPEVRADIEAEKISPGPFRRIYETCARLADEGITPEFDRLMLEFDEPAMKSLLIELDESGRAKGAHKADPLALQKLIKNFYRQEADKQRPKQIVALREEGLDNSRETELLEKIIRQEQNRQGISKSTDG